MPSLDPTDFQFLAENSADMICRVDLNQVLHYVSPSCLHILGWTPEEMVGTGPEAFVPAEDIPHIKEAVARRETPGGEHTTITIRMRTKAGPYAWMEINGRLVRNPATGEPVEVVLVMRNVTDRKLREDWLLSQALTDGLTGLANRRAFDSALEKEWKRTLRSGTQMSLLLLDVDLFKQFNDLYGHQFGDDCLRAIATAVTDTIRRDIDLVARYGGEEIAAILATTDAEGAILVAEKVRQAVAALNIPHAGNPEAGGVITVSVGVATALARHGGTMKMPESLLLAADHALYKAKHQGRNRVSTSLLMATQQP
jgi:diguanylate cyclase (GGDEF)-like protein/PAS domain S-box-containing protein